MTPYRPYQQRQIRNLTFLSSPAQLNCLSSHFKFLDESFPSWNCCQLTKRTIISISTVLRFQPPLYFIVCGVPTKSAMIRSDVILGLVFLLKIIYKSEIHQGQIQINKTSENLLRDEATSYHSTLDRSWFVQMIHDKFPKKPLWRKHKYIRERDFRSLPWKRWTWWFTESKVYRKIWYKYFKILADGKLLTKTKGNYTKYEKDSWVT